MIVPSSKLLFWVAVIVLPFALLAALVPGAAVVSLLFIGGLLATAIVDAVGAQKTLAGIGVELASVVRMSRDREGKLELRVRNERRVRQTVRLALPWPREIRPESETVDVRLPAESEWSRLSWP